METARKLSSLAALISVLWLGEGLLQAAPGPSLAYSTYLGGNRDDVVMSMAVDPAGNLYLTGMTNSSDFPFTGTPQSSRRATATASSPSSTGTGRSSSRSTLAPQRGCSARISPWILRGIST